MQTEQTIKKQRITLTDQLRMRLKGVMELAGGFLNRLGIHPNTLTLAGLAGNFIAAVFLARGEFLVGGIIALAMGPVDALDGTMARLRGESSNFGAFVDSVSDRYSELLIYGGLLTHYLGSGESLYGVLTFAAAAGAVMVSYNRARAEGLGFQAKIGILSRMERFVILIPSLILGFPWVGIGIIAVLANVTALQRIMAVRRQAHDREKN
ncbi:MAG: CDP-alcohol phosphatidyltransferase family protein [Chloroflexi bacterium]|nr:CDP-alcohol phosphatidyltransferase family protein [Chloroflexota bacterium]